ncbi:MAG: hypothetical protein FMNOHCHN_00575 [Ignavibacteriaceae bacterium]|nr:hypothetical protein [Ignavibacteriaceae bacterium]
MVLLQEFHPFGICLYIFTTPEAWYFCGNTLQTIHNTPETRHIGGMRQIVIWRYEIYSHKRKNKRRRRGIIVENNKINLPPTPKVWHYCLNPSTPIVKHRSYCIYAGERQIVIWRYEIYSRKRKNKTPKVWHYCRKQQD